MFKGYTLRNRLTIFFLMIISTLLIGSIGYVYIKTVMEGGSPTIIDALYWTVITISTLGYSNSGINLTSQAGELFSIFMVITGVFIIFVGIEIGVGPWFEEKMKKVVEKKGPAIPEKRHVIVAGLSELGEESVRELARRGISMVVVDPDAKKTRDMTEKNIPAVLGDPTREEVLSKARIKGASAIIITSDDSTNAFIALTARHMNRRLRIAASAAEKSSEKILRNSGASVVAMPEIISGEMLASRAIGEAEGARDIDGYLSLHQIQVDESSGMPGKRLSDIGKIEGVLPVGIRRSGDFIPYSAEITIKKGDILNLAATHDAVKRLKGGVV